MREKWGWVACALILFSGPPKFRIRDAEASSEGSIDAAIVAQLLVFLAVGVFLVYQFLHEKPQLQFTRLEWTAVCSIALMFISTGWSLSPSLTLVKATQVTIEFLFLCIFVNRFGVDSWLDVCFIGSAVMAAAIYFCWAFAPSLVMFETEIGEPRLRGLAIYETGHLAAIGIILLLSRRKSPWNPPLLVFFAVLLIASLARADWIAVALIMLGALVLRPKIANLKWSYCFWMLSPLVLLQLDKLLANFRSLEDVYDLTDRLGLWEHIVSSTMEVSAVFGSGFVAGSRLLGLEYNPLLGHAHSIYIEALGGMGVAGIICFVVLCALLAYSAIKNALSRSPESFALLSLLVFCLSVGVVGGELDNTPFGFVLWGLVPAIAVNSRSSTLVAQPEEIDMPRKPVDGQLIIMIVLLVIAALCGLWLVQVAMS